MGATGLRRQRRTQPTVQADHSGQRRAGAGQLQHRGATETETDRTDPAGIQRYLAGLRLEHVHRFQCTRTQQRPVVAQLAGHRSRLRIALRPHVLAVDISHQHHVVITGQLLGLLDGRLVHALPVRHHHQAGALVMLAIVIDQHTTEGRALVLPLHRLRLHRRPRRHRRQPQHHRHTASPTIHAPAPQEKGDGGIKPFSPLPRRILHWRRDAGVVGYDLIPSVPFSHESC